MKLVHQKDFSKTTDSPVNLWTVKDPQKPIASFEDFGGGFDPKDFCEVGTGTMPIQDILDAANAVGADFVILEQDFTQLSPWRASSSAWRASASTTGLNGNKRTPLLIKARLSGRHFLEAGFFSPLSCKTGDLGYHSLRENSLFFTQERMVAMAFREISVEELRETPSLSSTRTGCSSPPGTRTGTTP